LTIHDGAKVLNVKENVVLEYATIFLEKNSVLSFVFYLFSFTLERSLDLNNNLFNFTGILVKTLILNSKVEFLENNVLLQVLKTLKLNLNNEEVFTWDAIAFRIDRTLKHLKLTLNAEINAILDDVWTILVVLTEVLLHGLYIHEVRNVSFLVDEHLVLQFVYMISKPVLNGIGYVQIELFMRRCVKEKCSISSSINVFVVDEHYLSESIGMSEWKHIQIVHLYDKLPHVRTGDAWEEYVL
jgi:hypothetical protein